MNLESIKEQLESNENFKSLNKAIGLEFKDFSIFEDEQMIKKANSKIGKYSLFIKGGELESIGFDTGNESVRKYRLKKLGKIN